jgi:hypothetical protein
LQCRAAIALLGNYMAGSFVTTADGHGGMLLTQAAQTGQQPLLTHAVPYAGGNFRLSPERSR